MFLSLMGQWISVRNREPVVCLAEAHDVDLADRGWAVGRRARRPRRPGCGRCRRSSRSRRRAQARRPELPVPRCSRRRPADEGRPTGRAIGMYTSTSSSPSSLISGGYSAPDGPIGATPRRSAVRPSRPVRRIEELGEVLLVHPAHAAPECGCAAPHARARVCAPPAAPSRSWSSATIRSTSARRCPHRRVVLGEDGTRRHLPDKRAWTTSGTCSSGRSSDRRRAITAASMSCEAVVGAVAGCRIDPCGGPGSPPRGRRAAT